jgi:hypothetical protein
LKFSDVDPLRADTVESLLGVKLNDGVLEVFGGDAGFALELVGEAASEVVVGASGLKLGAACFVLSSGFANVNGLLALAGSLSGAFGAADVDGMLALRISVSGAFGAANENGLLALVGPVSVVFGAANEKEGNAGLLLAGAGGEVMAGKALAGEESPGEESPPSSTNGPAGLAGWLNKELGALCFGWPKGEAAGFGFVCSAALFVVGAKLKPPNAELGLSFLTAKGDSPGALGAGVSLFGWLNPENALGVEFGAVSNAGFVAGGI